MLLVQIFSNGKYKSVLHRVAVNNEKARISIAIANGPSLETVVGPARKLLRSESASYAAIKYKDYLLSQQSNQLNSKSMLKQIQIQNNST